MTGKKLLCFLIFTIVFVNFINKVKKIMTIESDDEKIIKKINLLIFSASIQLL